MIGGKILFQRNMSHCYSEYVAMTMVVVLHLFLGLYFFFPYAYRDEAMYIVNAGALAGFQSDFNNSYGIGLSLLLLPAVFVKNFISLHGVAVIINSIWHGFILLISSRLAKNIKIPCPLFCGVIISFYPSIWLYGNHAIPEVTIAFLILLMYLALFNYEIDFRLKYLVYFTLCGAVTSIMHPRMLVIVPVTFLILVLLVYSGKVVIYTALKLAFAVFSFVIGSFFKNTC